MNIIQGLGLCGLAFFLTGAMGCATSFTGSAKVPGGPAGCRDVCGGYGMELAGMVAMGEYSDGCICKVKGEAAQSDGTRIAVAGAGPAAVGVVMAMRERERQDEQQRQMQMQQMH